MDTRQLYAGTPAPRPSPTGTTLLQPKYPRGIHSNPSNRSPYKDIHETIQYHEGITPYWQSVTGNQSKPKTPYPRSQRALITWMLAAHMVEDSMTAPLGNLISSYRTSVGEALFLTKKEENFDSEPWTAKKRNARLWSRADVIAKREPMKTEQSSVEELLLQSGPAGGTLRFQGGNAITSTSSSSSAYSNESLSTGTTTSRHEGALPTSTTDGELVSPSPYRPAMTTITFLSRNRQNLRSTWPMKFYLRGLGKLNLSHRLANVKIIQLLAVRLNYSPSFFKYREGNNLYLGIEEITHDFNRQTLFTSGKHTHFELSVRPTLNEPERQIEIKTNTIHLDRPQQFTNSELSVWMYDDTGVPLAVSDDIFFIELVGWDDSIGIVPPLFATDPALTPGLAPFPGMRLRLIGSHDLNSTDLINLSGVIVTGLRTLDNPEEQFGVTLIPDSGVPPGPPDVLISYYKEPFMNRVITTENAHIIVLQRVMSFTFQFQHYVS